MKILCILQNTWTRDPERTHALLLKHQDRRHEVVARLLFASGCLTGKRFKTVFGDLMQQHTFIFDNASTTITGDSGGRPPYNVEHVRGLIGRHRPDVILALGSSAKAAFKDMRAARRAQAPLPPVVECIHPAVQKPGWLGQMMSAREQLEKEITIINHAGLALYA